MGDQFFVGDVSVFCERASEIEIGGGILVAPKRGGKGGDHQGNLSVGHAKEGSGAAFENVGVRALRFPGKAVECGECGDTAGCAWKNAAKEAQCFGEGLGTTIRIGHEECGAAKLARQI